MRKTCHPLFLIFAGLNVFPFFPRAILIFACFAAITALKAQPIDQPSVYSDACIAFSTRMDNLLGNWQVRAATLENGPLFLDNSSASSGPDLKEEEIRARLKTMRGTIPIVFHPDVVPYIKLLTVEKRRSAEVMLGLSREVFPHIEKALLARHMPAEIKYLPMVVSGMNWDCNGNPSRSGMWMLHYHVALRYGLKVNENWDERRIMNSATIAALDYIRDLYKQFNDWTLAVAAYSCGAAGVRKAISRSGGLKNFWQIYRYLDPDEREIIPALIAMAYTSRFYESHNLIPVAMKAQAESAEVAIREESALQHLAAGIGVPYGQMTFLNPAIRKSLVAVENGSNLKIPADKILTFQLKEEEIYAASKSSPGSVVTVSPKPATALPLPANGGTAPAPVVVLVPAPAPVHPKTNSPKIQYEIRQGDVLGTIAEKFHVTVNEIQVWNRISGTTIRTGEFLKIYVSEKVFTEYSGGATIHSPEKIPVPAKVPLQRTSGKTYTVKEGDSLWLISKNHPGVSADDIMEFNDITEKIKPGQVIRIPDP